MIELRRLSTIVIAAAILLSTATDVIAQADWRAELQKQLPLLGHRNWIVIADSAYPSQTAPGIKAIATGADQLEAVQAVLATLDRTRHVRGVVFLDEELPHVPERHAAGIGQYRSQLATLLKGRQAKSLPHEQIIEKLDEAGETFHILLLKTNLTLPYTSVFIRLDCGYWSDEAERDLRTAIQGAAGAK